MPPTRTSFKSCWEVLEKSLPRPSRVRKLLRRDWEGFKERVEREDELFCKSIVSSLYAGDCYVLSEAFDKDFMLYLKDKAFKFFQSEPSSFHQMKEGVKDFHKKIDLEEGRKYSFQVCKHAAYYFPWNEDPIFEPINERWRVIKKLMGLKETEYETNTPKEGVVDRIQLAQYPNRVGFLEPHSDPYLHQRLFISGYVCQRGRDYQGGGFYLVGNGNEVVDAEQDISIGDIGIGYATVYHGVSPCNREQPTNWDSDEGRWFLGLYSNVSDEVKDRHTGSSAKLNLPGVMP